MSKLSKAEIGAKLRSRGIDPDQYNNDPEDELLTRVKTHKKEKETGLGYLKRGLARGGKDLYAVALGSIPDLIALPGRVVGELSGLNKLTDDLPGADNRTFTEALDKDIDS